MEQFAIKTDQIQKLLLEMAVEIKKEPEIEQKFTIEQQSGFGYSVLWIEKLGMPAAWLKNGNGHMDWEFRVFLKFFKGAELYISIGQ